LKSWSVLFDNFNNTPYLPRLVIIKNWFAVVIILVGGHCGLHPIVSFASLPFRHALIVHLGCTAFRIFSFGLELQIFIVFRNIQFPVAFLFFLELLSILFSLLICQFLLCFCCSSDLLLLRILHPIDNIFICLLYFEMFTLFPAFPCSFLNVIHFGSIRYPSTLVNYVLFFEFFLAFLFLGLPAISVPCETLDAIHIHCLVIAVHYPVFIPYFRCIAIYVFLRIQIPYFGLFIFL